MVKASKQTAFVQMALSALENPTTRAIVNCTADGGWKWIGTDGNPNKDFQSCYATIEFNGIAGSITNVIMTKTPGQSKALQQAAVRTQVNAALNYFEPSVPDLTNGEIDIIGLMD